MVVVPTPSWLRQVNCPVSVRPAREMKAVIAAQTLQHFNKKRENSRRERGGLATSREPARQGAGATPGPSRVQGGCDWDRHGLSSIAVE
jgi:hypothetical protein